MDICHYSHLLSAVDHSWFHGKKEWNTVKGEQSYEAYFAYFNGEDQIPIKAKKGEVITVHVDFTNRNGGGYGYYVVDEKNRRIAMEMAEEDIITFQAKKTATYKLIITGDGLQGGFEVNWQKEWESEKENHDSGY